MYICIYVYMYIVYIMYINIYIYIYQMIRIMSRYSNHRCSTRDLCGLFKKHQIVASVIESHSLCPSEDPLRVRGHRARASWCWGGWRRDSAATKWLLDVFKPQCNWNWSQNIPDNPKISQNNPRIFQNIRVERDWIIKAWEFWEKTVGWSWLVMAFI